MQSWASVRLHVLVDEVVSGIHDSTIKCGFLSPCLYLYKESCIDEVPGPWRRDRKALAAEARREAGASVSRLRFSVCAMMHGSTMRLLVVIPLSLAGRIPAELAREYYQTYLGTRRHNPTLPTLTFSAQRDMML